MYGDPPTKAETVLVKFSEVVLAVFSGEEYRCCKLDDSRLTLLQEALDAQGLSEMVEALEEYARAERISQNCREAGLADGALKTALLGDEP